MTSTTTSTITATRRLVAVLAAAAIASGIAVAAAPPADAAQMLRCDIRVSAPRLQKIDGRNAAIATTTLTCNKTASRTVTARLDDSRTGTHQVATRTASGYEVSVSKWVHCRSTAKTEWKSSGTGRIPLGSEGTQKYATGVAAAVLNCAP